MHAQIPQQWRRCILMQQQRAYFSAADTTHTTALAATHATHATHTAHTTGYPTARRHPTGLLQLRAAAGEADISEHLASSFSEVKPPASFTP